MPNRILKESICTSDSIDALEWFDEVLYYRLIVNCDDYGRFDGRTAVVKNRLFPLKDHLLLGEVEEAIRRLEGAGLVERYEVEGKPYLLLPTWSTHQSVRSKRSKYPQPEIICKQMQADEIICKQMHADESKCPRNPIQSESNPNPNTNANANAKRETARAAAPFTPPTAEEVEAYCRQRGNSISPRQFVDYYQANGWVQGKGTPIRDWKAVVRTWENRDRVRDTKVSNGPTCSTPSPKELERFAQERERSRRVLEMMKNEERLGGQGPPDRGKEE